MANPKDFLARQIRTTQIIASGGVGFGSGAGLIIYSASNSSDLIGGLKDSVMLSKVGKDVFFFISGSQGSKSARNDPSNGDTGVTLFGGDVTVSGTLYAERMVVEVDMATTGTVMISGSLFVSRSASIGGGLDVNKYKEGRGSDDFVHHGVSGSRHIITSHASSNQVLILSGGNTGTTSPNEFLYSDLAFFVSGAVGSKNTRNKGVAVFGGDVAISGTVYGGNSSLNFGHSLLPSIDDTFDIGSATFAWKDIYLEGNVYMTDAGSVETAAGNLTIDSKAGTLNLDGHTGVAIDASSSGNVEINVTAGDDILIGNDAVAADIILGSSISTTSKVQTKSVVVEIDAGTGGVDIDSGGAILIDGVGASNLTTNGILEISGSTGLNLHSDGGEIDITSTHNGVDINAAANSSFSTTAGEIAIEAATGVIINGPSSITLDSDAKQIIIADNTVERGRIIADANLTISSSAGNDLQFDSNSGDFRFQKASAETLRIKNASDDVVFQPRQTGKDIVFQAQNSNQEIARFDSDKEVLAINTNKKLTFDGTTSQSEYISGDGTNLSIDSSNKVLILSGGAGSGINEALYTDTNFFVSGSLNSRQYPGKPGTAVFGGDMVVSGGIHLDYFITAASSKLSFANPQKTYIKVPGSDALDLSGNSVRIGSNISEISAYNPVDTNFFVSGAIDSKGKTANKGTSTFGGDVVISGSLYAEASNSIFVSEYIKCSRDTNSYIRFNGSDTIQFRAGGVTFAQLFEGTSDLWQINPDGNDVDLEVFADATARQGKYLIKGDAGNSQVLILSGGDPSSPNESLYTDLAFFVSGTAGSKDTSNKGVALFGGDVVISGTLHGGSPLSVAGGAIFNDAASAAADFRVESVGEDEALFVDSSVNTLYINKGETAFTTIIGSINDEALRIDASGASFNADGHATNDFRIASDNNTHMFFVDSGNNRLGIGTTGNSPQSVVHIKDTSPEIRIQRALNGQDSVISFAGSGGVRGSMTGLAAGTNDIVLKTFNGAALEETARIGGDYSGEGRRVILLSGSTMGVGAMQPTEATDINFFVSGSVGSRAGSQRGTSVFGGDVFISGSSFFGPVTIETTDPTITFKEDRVLKGTIGINSSDNILIENSTINKHIVMKVNDAGNVREAFRIDGAVSEVVVNQGSESLVDFRVESDNRVHALFVDGSEDQVYILSGGQATDVDESLYTDLALFVSGAIKSKGTIRKGTAVFGGDAVVSGAMYLEELAAVNIPGTIPDGTVAIYGKDASGVTKLYFKNESGETEIGGGGGTPGGNNGELQYNNGGAFGGLPKLTWDNTNFLLGASDITRLQFRDSGIYINSPANGKLGINSDGQVLIMSGGGATGPNESLYSDTNFFVSGALGSRQRSNKATAVFGGDLVVSGGLHLDYASRAEVRSDKLSFGNPGKTYIKTPGLHVLDLSGDNVRVGKDISETSQYNPSDTNFFVSGSVGKRLSATHGKSTAVFGGDVVISGSVYSKQTHVQRLGWAGTIANSDPRFPSFNGFGTSTNPDVENFIPVLGSGSLRQLDLWVSEPSTARIAISLFVNGKVIPKAEISGSFVNNNILNDGNNKGHLTIDFTDEFQKTNFLSGSNSFNPGDLFSIGISKLGGANPSNIIGILHYETDMLSPHTNQLGGLPE